MTCRLLISAALVLAAACPAAALQIVSPAPGAAVQPGALVPLRIALDPDESAVQVGVFSDGEAVPAQPVQGGYGAQVRVAREAVGPDLLVAYAVLQDGSVAFADVTVNVDPGPLRGLILDGPRALFYAGETAGIDVRGVFEDGVVRDLSAPQLGTTYTTSDENVLAVHPYGIVQARSAGTATLLVSSRGREERLEISVRISSSATNQIPTIAAGADQTVLSEQIVTLSASSSDADGDPVEYIWDQVDGRTVVLRNRKSATPAFISPRVAAPEVLQFLVAAQDSRGATTLPVLVRVTVNPAPTGQ